MLKSTACSNLRASLQTHNKYIWCTYLFTYYIILFLVTLSYLTRTRLNIITYIQFIYFLSHI